MREYENVSTLATPFLSIGLDVPVVVQIVSDFRLGQKREGSTMDPGTVVDVLVHQLGDQDLDPPREYTIGLSAVAKIRIEEKYPKHAMRQGKFFLLIKHAKNGGGKANPMTVREVKPKK